MKNVITYLCTLSGHPCCGCKTNCDNRAETDGDGDEVPSVSASGEQEQKAEEEQDENS